MILIHSRTVYTHLLLHSKQVSISKNRPNYYSASKSYSWAAGIICHTHQHYYRQWLPNNEWSNSRR